MPPESLPPPASGTSRNGVRIFIQIVLLAPLIQMLPMVFFMAVGVPGLVEEARWAAAVASTAAPFCAVALLASVIAPSRWHPLLMSTTLALGLLVAAWLASQWLNRPGRSAIRQWEGYPVYLFGGCFTVAIWNIVRIAKSVVKRGTGPH